jgi:hypothetical protein
MGDLENLLFFGGILLIIMGVLFYFPILMVFMNSGSVPNPKTPSYLKTVSKVLFTAGAFLLFVGFIISL